MIIKLFWYFSSLLVILLILLSNPKSSTLGLTSLESKMLSFRSSQIFIQKLISFFVFIFFLFTCLSLFFV
uniref:Preprotein-translocase subunit g n=1 Tax=Erythrocystis saccata TaxID=2822695 RepID=A0A8E6L257_9FLOR|nr:preprotein-translocase subunit g [Erythrocystis saccata]